MAITKDIADYYNQTLNHYAFHWKLNSSRALHYGLWYNSTKNLSEALENTNEKIAQLACIEEGYKIMDAGCGIGGTAIYLASNYNCEVVGVTLSEKQLQEGQKHITINHLTDKVQIKLANYEQTGFPDSSFDLVYGIESICHSVDKSQFIKEAFRILKPGGRMIVIDFFQQLQEMNQQDSVLMSNWLKRWAVKKLAKKVDFISIAENLGFRTLSKEDLTNLISPSAKKLHRASLIGSLPSKLYSLYNRNVSKYAKDHYKSGIYQYKALKKGLWNYSVLSFRKPLQEKLGQKNSRINPASI